jgi:hypothetical protein
MKHTIFIFVMALFILTVFTSECTSTSNSPLENSIQAKPTTLPTQSSTHNPTYTPTQILTQKFTQNTSPTPTQIPTQKFTQNPTPTPTQIPTQESTHIIVTATLTVSSQCTVNYETGTCPTGKCWVSDYCRKDGTHVNGYCRKCS